MSEEKNGNLTKETLQSLETCNKGLFKAISLVFFKKVFLKNFAKFTGKQLCQSFIFNKVAGFLKNKLPHRCFLVTFVKFLTIL